MTDSEDDGNDSREEYVESAKQRHRDSIVVHKTRRTAVDDSSDGNVDATPEKVSGPSVSAKSGLKLHLLWGCCSTALALLAFHMGAPTSSRQPGSLGGEIG